MDEPAHEAGQAVRSVEEELAAADANLRAVLADLREEAEATARSRRVNLERGITSLTGTVLVWLAAKVFDFPLHSFWYYVPTLLLGSVLLAIGILSAVLHKKYVKLVHETEADLRKTSSRFP